MVTLVAFEEGTLEAIWVRGKRGRPFTEYPWHFAILFHGLVLSISQCPHMFFCPDTLVMVSPYWLLVTPLPSKHSQTISRSARILAKTHNPFFL